MTTEEEKVDETFEIISLKEKYLKDQLKIAEDAKMKSEANVSINDAIIGRLNAEIEKEHEKNL